jgi:hypothetical protein
MGGKRGGNRMPRAQRTNFEAPFYSDLGFQRYSLMWRSPICGGVRHLEWASLCLTDWQLGNPIEAVLDFIRNFNFESSYVVLGLSLISFPNMIMTI